MDALITIEEYWNGKPKLTPPRAWLLAHVGYQGDECLIWPFGKDSRGYGQVSWNRKIRRAHRVMCQLVHGDPPTPEHHAAHSCGNGHKGCVHPQHVSWKTASENQLDRRKHGTHGGSMGFGLTKLNMRAATAIRAARGKVTQKRLAEIYGVSDATIRDVQAGRYWRS